MLGVETGGDFVPRNISKREAASVIATRLEGTLAVEGSKGQKLCDGSEGQLEYCLHKIVGRLWPEVRLCRRKRPEFRPRTFRSLVHA